MFEELIVGIDFGTSNCCISIFDNDKIIVIENSDGDRITPSYLFFADGDDIITGKFAKKRAEILPNNGIYEMKRLIGRKFDDPYLQILLEYLVYDVTNDDVNDPVIIIQETGEKMAKTVDDLCCLLFQKLKSFAENKFRAPLKKAVVTVPAFFKMKQKEAIQKAAIKAGFSVLKLVNESTAAALCYFFERGEAITETSHFVVYDLGGGTFDVAVLKKSLNNIEIISIDGDSQLGGNDFDNIIKDYVCDEIMANYKYDLKKDKLNMMRLHEKCEEAKHALSTMKEYDIHLIGFVDGQNTVTITLTREKFEELANDLFVKTIRIVDRCLKSSNIDKHLIKEVILVGGSTRIPKIQEMLSQFFKGKALSRFINPDEAVARGAAIQAAMLSKHPSQNFQKIKITDVVTLSIGIEDIVGRMEILIKRNTPIPCNATKILRTTYDQQSTVKIKVYEGERLDVRKNHIIAILEVSDITLAPVEECQIIFKMDVNENGTLTFKAEEKFRNNLKGLIVNNLKADNLNLKLKSIITDAEKMKIEDREFAQTAEARAYLYEYCDAISKNLFRRGITKEHKLVMRMCRKYKFEALANFHDMSLSNIKAIITNIKEKCEILVLNYKFDNMPKGF